MTDKMGLLAEDSARKVSVSKGAEKDAIIAKILATGVVKAEKAEKGGTMFVTLKEAVLREEKDNGGNENRLIVATTVILKPKKGEEGHYEEQAFGLSVKRQRRNAGKKDWVYTGSQFYRPQEFRDLCDKPSKVVLEVSDAKELREAMLKAVA